MSRQSQIRNYEKRKRLNLCVKCSEKKDISGVVCQRCKDVQRKRYTDNKAGRAYKESGRKDCQA